VRDESPFGLDVFSRFLRDRLFLLSLESERLSL